MYTKNSQETRFGNQKKKEEVSEKFEKMQCKCNIYDNRVDDNGTFLYFNQIAKLSRVTRVAYHNNRHDHVIAHTE